MAGTSRPSRTMHLWRTNAPDEIHRRGERMKKCDVCGSNMTHKFGFCLKCGRINHDYKPADYVKSEELGK